MVRVAPAIVVALLCVVALSSADTVHAHPLGSGVINRYARLDSYSDAVRLTYVLDYGWMATGQYLPYADTNKDGQYSQDELDAFTRSVQTTYGYALRLSVRSEPLDLEPAAASLTTRADPNGFPTIKLTMIYDARLPEALSGDVLFQFEDLNFEDNAVWKEIVVYGSPGAVVDVPAEFTVELSEGLDSYPPLDQVTIPSQDKAGWSWQAGTGSPLPAAVVPTTQPPTNVALPRAAPPADGGSSVAFDWRIAAAVGGAVVVAVVGRLVFVRLRQR